MYSFEIFKIIRKTCHIVTGNSIYIVFKWLSSPAFFSAYIGSVNSIITIKIMRMVIIIIIIIIVIIVKTTERN